MWLVFILAVFRGSCCRKGTAYVARPVAFRQRVTWQLGGLLLASGRLAGLASGGRAALFNMAGVAVFHEWEKPGGKNEMVSVRFAWHRSVQQGAPTWHD